MKLTRTVCALLLGVPLIVFGAGYFIKPFPMPPEADAGVALLQAMRTGGLMSAIAFSHVVAGLLLVVPRTRFLGALLQLPMTIGMLAFHATMLPAGIVFASLLLLLNLGALADPPRLRALI